MAGRPKGSKNRATLAAQAAFREQIIKEHQLNMTAEKPPERPPEKPPEEPPEPSRSDEVIAEREDLDLEHADASLAEIESDEPDEPLDLEPPPSPSKKRSLFTPPEVKPRNLPIDKPAVTSKTSVKSKSRETSKPTPMVRKKPLGGVFRR